MTGKRSKHLRVPVSAEEERVIKRKAQDTGLPVARYMRLVSQGYMVQSTIDLCQVEKLLKINGDLGRAGGLLKLWLSDDRRAAGLDRKAIFGVLQEIRETQGLMSRVLKRVVARG
ncbi:plasmid mobilization protein [Nitrosomonas aestuarii]|uniref:plasmid mobilization protein n=1 Tax=Nitrosomonas aestuarii TaxID=52441 RepID=UPI000D31577F|nr:conjugal transfer protein TraJ [Nitrosomonas aestuarii]PTN09681.1 hypothetical protein C8R11_12220 [Nitrosomonas aestuarii]